MALITCLTTTDCWCRDCNIQRLTSCDDLNVVELRRELETLLRREKEAKILLFEQVMKGAAVCKAFRLQLLREEGYKYTKPYLLSLGLDRKRATVMADKINRGSNVYDNLQRIINNLYGFPEIDIRRLSMKQLYMAKEESWCRIYAQSLIEKT